MDTATCPYCTTEMALLDCAYPFWYHAHEAPRHGEWVPAHDCPADYTGDVEPVGCGYQEEVA